MSGVAFLRERADGLLGVVRPFVEKCETAWGCRKSAKGKCLRCIKGDEQDDRYRGK